MSRQGSQHDFPELGEDEDDLDLPSREEQDWEDKEWGLVDPSWFDFVGEDKDLDDEDDFDPFYDPYDYFDWDAV